VAIQPIIRVIQGSTQCAAAGTSNAACLQDWSNAASWIATVELRITAVGVSSEQTNAYYRREVFKWVAGAAHPAAVGALVAATILEEDSAWDAVVALATDAVQVQTTGDAVEKVNFSWYGKVTLQQV
jgi:hypothetical protein